MFTVVEVGNHKRSIRYYPDFIDIFTHGLSSVFWVPSFLSRDRYTRAVVLKFPTFDLYLRAVQVLGGRVSPILDPTATPQFPARGAGAHVVVILFGSIRPLVRQPPILQGPAAGSFPLRVSIPRTTWDSCVRFHIHPPVRIAYTNNPPIRRLATVYLLVGGTSTG